MRNVIELRKNIVDISFFPENALELDALARQHKVTALVDMGVAPGMSNLLLGHHNESMRIECFECLVGGLPLAREFPFEYKAPFSPIDVIEEYTRPARLMENGTITIKPALSDCETVNIEHVSTLEAFNTDGLRSLLTTMAHIPNMKEKTLRYPGHAKLIQALQTSGFFDTDAISLNDNNNGNGQSIAPIQLTSKLLEKAWQLKEQEPEITVMRIMIRGIEQETAVSYQYNLYDQYDQQNHITSMARTTGYTCCAAVNVILDQLFTQKGVHPPEHLGKYPDCFNAMMSYLANENIHYQQHRTVLQSP